MPRTSPPTAAPDKPRTLWVKLPSREHPSFQRLQLLLTMFPGNEPIILYFEDTKKRLGGQCLIHDALVAELRERLGEGSVVIR